MPNQPKTPNRNVRVHDAVWTAAREKAAREGTTVTAIVVARLERWTGVKTPDDDDPKNTGETPCDT